MDWGMGMQLSLTAFVCCTPSGAGFGAHRTCTTAAASCPDSAAAPAAAQGTFLAWIPARRISNSFVWKNENSAACHVNER